MNLICNIHTEVTIIANGTSVNDDNVFFNSYVLL